MLTNRIKQARKAAGGMSQNDLGQALNMHRTAVVRYENDRQVPSVLVALEMARALNTTVEYLFGNGGTDDAA